MASFAEYESKDFGEEEPKKQCFESPIISSEERREESNEEFRESDERQIESHLSADGFLRTSDSDEESFTESENNKIVINSEKESNESQSNNKRTEPKDAVVVSSNSTGDSLSKTKTQTNKSQTSRGRDDRKPKNYKMINKWGESVGITDSKGMPKRLVNLSEVKNYIPLKMKFRSEFKFYFSLIDSRYPQRFRSYGSDKQRWRMRYNVFVDGLFDVMKKFECILHVGEIIIYFDIAKNMSHPYYANCSFYANYSPLESSVDTTKLTRLIFRLHDVLTSKLMLQLKFPVETKSFRNTDHMYFKFMTRQKEMMDELLYIQSRQWSSAKWLSIDPKRANVDSSLAFGRLSIDYKTESNRKSDDQRRKRTAKSNRNVEQERVRTSGADNRVITNRSEDYHSKRVEENGDRRFGGDSNRRLRNPSNRRTSEQSFAANPLRETASDFSQMWGEDRNQSKNLPQKTNQRRNPNSDRFDGQNSVAVRPPNTFRGGRREERRSRPKTRRH